jgi:hypothetical protein
MNALVLDMPDDPTEQAPWLDRKLVGPDLAALVAELDAVHGRAQPAPQPPPALDTLLGGNRRAVLQRGLSVLPRPALGMLLRHPRLLLELQEAILLQGAPIGRISTAPIPGWRPASLPSGTESRLTFTLQRPSTKTTSCLAHSHPRQSPAYCRIAAFWPGRAWRPSRLQSWPFSTSVSPDRGVGTAPACWRGPSPSPSRPT